MWNKGLPVQLFDTCVSLLNMRIGTVIAFVALSLGLQPATAQQIELKCFGEVATIVGTDNDDEIEGTEGRDVIVGLNGKDTIDGKGGNDLICSGHGLGGFRYDDNELVLGGPGNDHIDGGPGPNELRGGDGNDVIRAHKLIDYIYGDGGDDTIWAGAEDDEVSAGTGNDVLFLGEGRDFGSGEVGNDRVHGGLGWDFLGDDAGFACGEVCYPDPLSDEGDDYIHGGPGRDLISFGLDDDLIIGGRGIDAATYASEDPDAVFAADLEAGTATGAGNDEMRDIENLTAFSHGDISLFGDDGRNRLAGGNFGNAGPSTIIAGRGGPDMIEPQPGAGPVGSPGQLRVEGGDGDDHVFFLGCHSRSALWEFVKPVLDMGDGDDGALASCMDDQILGGPGDDSLAGGSSGEDFIDGGPGHDRCDAETVVNCEEQPQAVRD